MPEEDDNNPLPANRNAGSQPQGMDFMSMIMNFFKSIFGGMFGGNDAAAQEQPQSNSGASTGQSSGSDSMQPMQARAQGLSLGGNGGFSLPSTRVVSRADVLSSDGFHAFDNITAEYGGWEDASFMRHNIDRYPDKMGLDENGVERKGVIDAWATRLAKKDDPDAIVWYRKPGAAGHDSAYGDENDDNYKYIVAADTNNPESIAAAARHAGKQMHSAGVKGGSAQNTGHGLSVDHGAGKTREH